MSTKRAFLCVSQETNLTSTNGGIEEALFRGTAKEMLKRDAAAVSTEQLLVIAQALKQNGLEQVILFGGEPMLRSDITLLIEKLSSLGIKNISMLTNASLLAEPMAELKEAGLTGVYIALDTLDPAKYEILTGEPDFDRVSSGLAAAESAGLMPLHFVVQPAARFNDDELMNFGQLTLFENTEIIFVEREGEMLDAMGEACPFLSNVEIRERFAGAIEETKDEDPMRTLRFQGVPGCICLLDTTSERFINNAEALVISADGCAFSCDGKVHVDLAAASLEGSDVVLNLLTQKGF